LSGLDEHQYQAFKSRYLIMLKHLGVVFTRWWIVAASAILIVLVLCWALAAQSSSPGKRVIARGAGTTILEGGTGSPDFIPVMTEIAFHVEIVDGAVIGNFECLARAPHTGTGPTSAAFDTNVMYVTGSVEGVAIDGDTIRISGGSDCTGIGAGRDVPFSAEIQKGGPGASVVLTAGVTGQVFRETLLNGSFEIVGQLPASTRANVVSPRFVHPGRITLQR
jgi:hypothetical protein